MQLFTTNQVAHTAGCRLEDLSRWRDHDLVGPPIWVPGHGKAGRVSMWSISDARRAWCLTRIDGRFHNQWSVLEQVDLHHSGVMYVTDKEVCCGDPVMLKRINDKGGFKGGRLLVLDLQELEAAITQMVADRTAG